MRKPLHVFVLIGMLIGGAFGAQALGVETGHVVSIDDLTVTEGNGNDSPSVQVTVHVNPAPGVGEQVLVDFGTSAQAAQGATATTTAPGDDTPTFPEDFAQTDGTVTFDTPLTEQTISVPVLRDYADEASETFFVRLFNARKECLIACTDGASIGDSSATVTIGDDDAAPEISISDKTRREDAEPETTTYLFTVTKVGGSAQTVSVDYATADDSATAPSDYTATSGSLSFEPSSPSVPEKKIVSVEVHPDGSFEPSETFKVNLTNASYASIADGEGVGTILNDDDPPPPSMVVSDASDDEGDTLSFAVTLSSPPGPGQTAIVDWMLLGSDGEGAATEGSDYAAASGQLLYTAGETQQTISVPTVEDVVNELDESFTLKLTKPAVPGTGGYTYNISDDLGAGTIVNDDAAPTLQIDDVTIEAEGGDEDTTVATFTVTKSGLTDRAVGVDFATTDGTASSSDYTSSQGDLSFGVEDVEKEVTVEVKGDVLDEVNETFVVELSNPTNATIEDGFGVGTITDDDSAPTLSIGDVTVTEGNAAVAANFTVTKTGPTALSSTVRYATADGTAKSGADYNARTGTVSFAPGETSKVVGVVVRGDVLDEWRETFVVNLSDATNASISDAQSLATIVDNDAPPTMSITDGQVTESSSSACTLQVKLSAVSGREVRVHYETVSGTAGTADYVTKSGDLTFVPGDATEQVKVFARADTKDEPTEKFSVKLSAISPSATATFADSTGVCSILDND